MDGFSWGHSVSHSLPVKPERKGTQRKKNNKRGPPRGTLVEPGWNPSWNLTSGPPRTTPEPIWAETPKLSAVGEQKRKLFPNNERILTLYTCKWWLEKNTHFKAWLLSLLGPPGPPLGSAEGKREGLPIGGREKGGLPRSLCPV